MKTSFALDLRFSVIALLHRTAQGWIKVGEAAMGAPDFVEALGVMRATALDLSPKGITTKVILPNAHILYTRVAAPAGAAASPRHLIDAALADLTPYRLDELAYDWCNSQSGLQVAVVAKETLEEAETFAREHRFNPVCFVAVPEGATFAGEPFFGLSNLSKSLLAKDETVERDTEMVQVVARDPAQSPPVPAAPIATPDAITPQKAQPTPPPQDAQSTPASATPPPPSNLVAPAQEISYPPAPRDAPKPPPREPQPENSTKSPPKPAALPHSATTAKVPAAPRPEVPEAPMVVDVEQDVVPAAPPIVPKIRMPEPTAPDRTVAAAYLPRDVPAVGPTPPLRAPVPRPAGAKPPPVLVAAGRPKAAQPGQTEADLAKTSATLDRAGKPKRITPAQQRRYIILILTAVLVLLLGMMALWVALSLGTKEAKNRAAGPAAVVAQAESSTHTGSTPSGVTSNATGSPAQSAALAPTQAVGPATTPTAAPNPVPPPEVTTQNIAAAMQDTAGQDEIFLASADTPPVSLDPIALPALEVGADAAPFLPESPPPYLPLESPPAALMPAPEGAPLSDGALVMAQPTPIAPIQPPQSFAPSPPADAAFQTPAAPKGAPLLAQDLTLASKRPLIRPTDLVPVIAVPSGANALAPDSRYARLKPQPRPEDLNAPALAQPAQPNTTLLGTSPKPQPRPTDIKTGLDGAVTIALNQAPADQPKAEAPAPTLPTSASVAKQATEKAALHANRLALLAVFGTPTSRFAMIRLAGGRVKKVKVGDMIDGGRIAGMTADAVQYQKGGRIVTLTLPQG